MEKKDFNQLMKYLSTRKKSDRDKLPAFDRMLLELFSLEDEDLPELEPESPEKVKAEFQKLLAAHAEIKKDPLRHQRLKREAEAELAEFDREEALVRRAARARKLYFTAAAVVPVLLAASALWYVNRPVEPVPVVSGRVLEASGEIIRLRGDSESPVRAGTEFQEGDGFMVFSGELMFAGGRGIVYRLEGPAVLEFIAFRPVEIKNHFRLSEGRLSFHSETPMEDVVLFSDHYRYRPTGTTASLEVETDRERLAVLDGEFRVSAQGAGQAEKPVVAGQTVQLKSGLQEIPPAEKLRPVDRRRLEKFQESAREIRAKLQTDPEYFRKEKATARDGKKSTGPVATVHLKNGAVLRGQVGRAMDMYFVRTEDGRTLRIPAKEVERVVF